MRFAICYYRWLKSCPRGIEYPDGFRLVLREIDRFLARRSTPAKTSIAQELSADVKEAARLLAGKSIVLIGGNRRREAQEALRKAMGLKDLIWIETREHEAIAGFEPLIRGPTWPWCCWPSAGRAMRLVP